MTAHAKNRPPSAAKRWLACPFSAMVAPLYPEDPSVQSLKGDTWHEIMEAQILFGTLPLDCDPDAAEAMEELYEYVKKRVADGGPGTKVYVEQVLDIPQTGEFGTTDIMIVAPAWIEIIDLKGGYVPVEAHENAQELVYLLGAIAKHGPRDEYKLTIYQPNYDHIDGPLRHWTPTIQDLANIEYDIAESMSNPDRVHAGPHCKATYCNHRGACEAFGHYAQWDLSIGWHSSELKSNTDDWLSAALEASDELGGYRNELRSEAMRRIINMDRQVQGWKVVKGRRSRAVRDPRGLTTAVADALGIEWARRMFPDLAWVQDLPIEQEQVLKQLGTPKHIEDVIKQYARMNKFKRGAWKELYDKTVGEYILETASGLTLEKAIDGRPAHRRGSEFGVIDPASTPTVI